MCKRKIEREEESNKRIERGREKRGRKSERKLERKK